MAKLTDKPTDRPGNATASAFTHPPDGGLANRTGLVAIRTVPAPRTPARHVSLNNFVRLKIAPRVLDAMARKRNDIGSVVIYTEEFDWRSFRRKLINNERRDPIA